MRLRTSLAHWSTLARLVDRLTRAVELCARLDAYRRGDPLVGNGAGHPPMRAYVRYQGQQLWLALDRLETMVGHEIDRVTAEWIRVELATKQRRAAAAIPPATTGGRFL